jgi:hypothetical protein
MEHEELLNKYKVALLFACRTDRSEQFIERCTVDRSELNYALKQADKMDDIDKERVCKGFFNE